MVEVNGENIAQENHKQVVARIKSRSRETTLLVADSACDVYHKEKDIVITARLPYVIRLANVSEDDIRDSINDDDEEEEFIDTRMQKVSFNDDINNVKRGSDNISDNSDKNVDRQDSGVDEDDIDNAAVKHNVNNSARNSTNNDIKISELGLNLSVEEVKERIRRNRKHDPRSIPMKRASGEWWNQYKMIQNI